MLGDGKRILRVPLQAQMQRLDSLQQQERVERRECRAGVAQTLHASFQDERQRTERFPVGNAVVRRIGLDEVREAAGGFPVELAAIDDDAADGIPVAAKELRRRVDHDVRPVLDRTKQGRRGRGVVDNVGNAVLVRDGGNLLEVNDVELRIAERFGEERLGAIVMALRRPS